MSSFPHASVGLFRPPLAVPAIRENIYADLGQELANYLQPLTAYCDRLEAQHDERPLTQAQADHVFDIRQAVDAVLRYDAQGDELLAYYRTALTAGQELAAAQVPALEGALSPDWQHIARLLFKRLRPHLPAYTPSPMEDRMSCFLSQPHLQQRLALPIDERRDLTAITSYDLNPDGHTS